MTKSILKHKEIICHVYFENITCNWGVSKVCTYQHQNIFHACFAKVMLTRGVPKHSTYPCQKLILYPATLWNLKGSYTGWFKKCVQVSFQKQHESKCVFDGFFYKSNFWNFRFVGLWIFSMYWE